MLIDSGAEVSVISPEIEEAIKQNGQLPTLPLIGLNVYNATGNKITKAIKQVLLPIKLKNETIQSPFIVVPQLNEGGILGNDFLEKNKAILDFENKKLTLKVENRITQIPFTNKRVIDDRKEEDRRKTREILKWIDEVEKATKPNEREKQWKRPVDWRIVNEKTLHKYIPFGSITMAYALEHITQQLDAYGPPEKKYRTTNSDTPLWYLSRNAVRRALCRASVHALKGNAENLPPRHVVSPVSNLGGEL